MTGELSVTQSHSAPPAAVVVSSCDSYHDAWGPFFALLQRYWPDNPWPVYLITEHRDDVFPGVRTLPLGQDSGWAGNLLDALDLIEPEAAPRQIVYLQEDYFLQSPVPQVLLAGLMDWMAKEGTGYVRLSGAPGPDTPGLNEFGVGRLSKDASYRCSLQAAVWDVEVLRSLLVRGETGWDMEGAGTERSRTCPAPFYARPMNAPLLDYYFYTGILKGKWVPGALRLCRREGIPVDTSQRGIHSEWPFLVRKIRYSPPVWAVRRFLRRLKGKAA